MKRTITTLTYIPEGDKLLLGMKKRGFGAGKWNGFGGKVHKGETVEEAARRELLEEAEIVADKIEQIALFTFLGKALDEIIEVHVYKVAEFSGVPQETEEMTPKWFDINELPYSDMWPDDTIWMPLVATGKKLRGEFVFEVLDKVDSYTLEEVAGFELV